MSGIPRNWKVSQELKDVALSALTDCKYLSPKLILEQVRDAFMLASDYEPNQTECVKFTQERLNIFMNEHSKSIHPKKILEEARDSLLLASDAESNQTECVKFAQEHLQFFIDGLAQSRQTE